MPLMNKNAVCLIQNPLNQVFFYRGLSVVTNTNVMYCNVYDSLWNRTCNNLIFTTINFK